MENVVPKTDSGNNLQTKDEPLLKIQQAADIKIHKTEITREKRTRQTTVQHNEKQDNWRCLNKHRC